MNNSTKEYAIATGLKGFRSTELRVVVTRRDPGLKLAWVCTADLLDAGTRLVLDEAQVTTPCPDAVATEFFSHPTGLLAFGAA